MFSYVWSCLDVWFSCISSANLVFLLLFLSKESTSLRQRMKCHIQHPESDKPKSIVMSRSIYLVTPSVLSPFPDTGFLSGHVCRHNQDLNTDWRWHLEMTVPVSSWKSFGLHDMFIWRTQLGRERTPGHPLEFPWSLDKTRAGQNFCPLQLNSLWNMSSTQRRGPFLWC